MVVVPIRIVVQHSLFPLLLKPESKFLAIGNGLLHATKIYPTLADYQSTRTFRQS